LVKFLNELTRLFSNSREKGGSLYVTLKRMNKKPEGPSKIISGGPHPQIPKKKQPKVEVPPGVRCLIRAQTAKRKISTIIQAKDLDNFRTVIIFKKLYLEMRFRFGTVMLNLRLFFNPFQCSFTRVCCVQT
jgi:hypothetical protein